MYFVCMTQKMDDHRRWMIDHKRHMVTRYKVDHREYMIIIGGEWVIKGNGLLIVGDIWLFTGDTS